MAQISLNLPDLEAERISLGEFLARPDAYSASDFTAKNKRFSELEVLIEKAKEREQLTQNLAEAKELAGVAMSWQSLQKWKSPRPKHA